MFACDCDCCSSVALDLSQEHDHLRVGGDGDDGRPGSALGKRFRRTASQVGNALSGITQA